MQSDVRRMLRPGWSIVWTLELHHRFPPDQRAKARLIIEANVLAQRPRHAAAAGWPQHALALLLLLPWRAPAGRTTQVRWTYLSRPLLVHILELALTLW